VRRQVRYLLKLYASQYIEDGYRWYRPDVSGSAFSVAVTDYSSRKEVAAGSFVQENMSGGDLHKMTAFTKNQ